MAPGSRLPSPVGSIAEKGAHAYMTAVEIDSADSIVGMATETLDAGKEAIL